MLFERSPFISRDQGRDRRFVAVRIRTWIPNEYHGMESSFICLLSQDLTFAFHEASGILFSFAVIASVLHPQFFDSLFRANIVCK